MQYLAVLEAELSHSTLCNTFDHVAGRSSGDMGQMNGADAKPKNISSSPSSSLPQNSDSFSTSSKSFLDTAGQIQEKNVGQGLAQGTQKKSQKKSALAAALMQVDDSDDDDPREMRESGIGSTDADVDYNLLKNLLESHALTMGGPGPASNLLSQLGLALPRAPPMHDRDSATKKNSKSGPK